MFFWWRPNPYILLLILGVPIHTKWVPKWDAKLHQRCRRYQKHPGTNHTEMDTGWPAAGNAQTYYGYITDILRRWQGTWPSTWDIARGRRVGCRCEVGEWRAGGQGVGGGGRRSIGERSVGQNASCDGRRVGGRVGEQRVA